MRNPLNFLSHRKEKQRRQKEEEAQKEARRTADREAAEHRSKTREHIWYRLAVSSNFFRRIEEKKEDDRLAIPVNHFDELRSGPLPPTRDRLGVSSSRSRRVNVADASVRAFGLGVFGLNNMTLDVDAINKAETSWEAREKSGTVEHGEEEDEKIIPPGVRLGEDNSVVSRAMRLLDEAVELWKGVDLGKAQALQDVMHHVESQCHIQIQTNPKVSMSEPIEDLSRFRLLEPDQYEFNRSVGGPMDVGSNSG